MLLEATKEPLVYPSEAECLYADNFTKSCEIIKYLPPEKKNVFLYVCMFLVEVLKNNSHNRMDADRLGKNRKQNKIFILVEN